MGGMLGVNKGSDEPPRLIKMTYSPRNPTGSVALVGKGITFDSGGLSLKSGEGMMSMKIDMSGAAAVLATMSALKATKPKVKVVAFLLLHRQHAEWHGAQARRRDHDPQRQDRRGAEHRRRGTARPRRRAVARGRGERRCDRRPRDADRRGGRRVGQPHRRRDGQRRRLDEPGAQRCGRARTRTCGRSRSRPSTGASSTRRSRT